ncbi:vWA domain-containing protein [Infirmifilum sp.]|uniref:vWA domain-containing protein n=1 Tax=Infirmifilum sp. TaxID=2856575 RepID=UPI003D0B6E41
MRLGFEHPEALALLVLFAAAVFLLQRSRFNRRRIQRFFDVSISRLNYLLEAARITALLCLVLAAAVPYVEYTVKRQVPFDGLSELSGKKVLHLIVVDVSRSMTYPLGLSTRFNVAKDLLEKYLQSLGGGDLVHLAVFSSSARPICQGAASECIKALKGLEAGERYTALGDAILYASSVARVSAMPTVVVLVSDGVNNYGSDPLQVAESLKEENLPVVLVAVGDYGVLPRVAETLGSKLFTVDEFSLEAVKSLAARAAAEARYSALLARGEAYVEEARRSYLPTHVLLAAAFLMILATLIDGV